MDVEKKVVIMIDVYKECLVKNDWLIFEIWEKVIVKFNVIKFYIGYLKELLVCYKDKVVDEFVSFFENVLVFVCVEIKYSWSKWN